jgi:F0F1-type ATP synthase assembly protein I
MFWASRVTSAALGFVLPAVVGAYADRRFASSPIGTLIGIGLGFVAGTVSVVNLARSKPGGPGPGRRG